MNTLEFSNEFDTLLNSYIVLDLADDIRASDYNIVLDEYEKSVYLTKALESLVIDIYSGKNSYGDSFEDTEEIRRYLSNLVKTYSVTIPVTDNPQLGLSTKSKFYEIPEDVWFITYESATLKDESLGCWNGSEIIVKPVSQDEYFKVSNNPFRGISKRRALRLDVNNNMVEIVSDYNIQRYLIRYLSKPNPIVLEDLTDGLSINGVNKKSECTLHSAVHRVILERGVRLAIQDKITGINKE